MRDFSKLKEKISHIAAHHAALNKAISPCRDRHEDFPGNSDREHLPIVDSPYRIIKIEVPCGHIIAIDGSDNEPVSFVNGCVGIAAFRTGWEIMDKNLQVLDKAITNLQLALVDDGLQAFRGVNLYHQAHFGGRRIVSTDSVSIGVRRAAAFYRQMDEWNTLKVLLDRGIAQTGDIVLLDGFLKANMAPQPDYIEYIGRRYHEVGIRLIGIAKRSKIDITAQRNYVRQNTGSSLAWFKVPDTVIDKAYGLGGGMYITLGRNGRGVGVPIWSRLSSHDSWGHLIDINCWDLEAYRMRRSGNGGGKITIKDVYLTDRDKEFIDETLSEIAFYSNDLLSLGYPLAALKIHREVKIKNSEAARIKSRYISELISKGIPISQIIEMQEEPHKTLDF